MIPIPQYPDRPAALPTWADDAIDELCAASAKKAAEEAFTEAIERGLNRVLPIDGIAAQWPVSRVLGQTYSAVGCAALFKACHLAMSRKDADCAEALRAFVKAAAVEYSEDCGSEWL